MGRAVVNHETDNWPKYFDGLREVTRKAVGEGTIIGLSKIEKAELTRRLTESIDELEHELRKELTKPCRDESRQVSREAFTLRH